jgi:hypothetical protein
MKKLDYIVVIILVTCVLLTTYMAGYTIVLKANSNPPSDLFWINNTRIHKDSVIDCRPIYNEYSKIIGSWIRVTHGNSTVMIECLDLDGSSWMEYRDSWIVSFKVGCGDMTLEEALEELNNE